MVRVCRFLVALILIALPVQAATGTLLPAPWFTALDTNGNPIALAKACFYTAGTSTPATTYSDVALTTPNANPLRANGSGVVGPVYLTPGQSYKFTLQDATGTAGNCDGAVVRTQDSIAAVPTSSGVVDLTGTAGEAITAGQAVYLSAGDGGKTPGSWYKADSANTYSTTTNYVGIATVTIASGNQGNIRRAGSVTGLTVAAGTKYYIGTAGALTSTAPTNARLLGEADTATSLVLDGPVVVPQSWLTGAPVSGGVPYFDSATTAKSSAALGANAVVLGGGAGATPFSEAGFTISQTGSHSLNSTTQPRAGAFNSAGVSIPNNARTAITFNSDDAQMTNVGSMHSTSVATSRMTVPTGGDGLYAVTCTVPWAGNATGQRQVGVSKNGTVLNPLIIVANMAGAGVFTMSTPPMLINAVATDYFECTAFQDSGGALNAGTDGTTGRPQMYVEKRW